jgi:hypothetical protein
MWRSKRPDVIRRYVACLDVAALSENGTICQSVSDGRARARASAPRGTPLGHVSERTGNYHAAHKTEVCEISRTMTRNQSVMMTILAATLNIHLRLLCAN